MDTVERQVTLPTDLGAAWALVTRPDDLAAWLGAEVDLDPTPGATGQVVDHDGTRRRLVVEEVDEARRLTWRWWDDEGAASVVELTLSPADDGTRLTVVERPLPPPDRTAARASAAPAAEAWSFRLLHLEALLLVAAAVRG
jgi:uncharacterized protein YndB with AHSA1/START domain